MTKPRPKPYHPAALLPIDTAPDLERVMVAGIQPRGTCQAYWWWHEDCVSDGKAIDHPEATHWFAIALPDFPPVQHFVAVPLSQAQPSRGAA